VHSLHEVAVGEIPLLEHDLVTRTFENVTNPLGEKQVGAGPADEEIRKLLQASIGHLAHRAPRGNRRFNAKNYLILCQLCICATASQAAESIR
jgi:hypothetical protein